MESQPSRRRRTPRQHGGYLGAEGNCGLAEAGYRHEGQLSERTYERCVRTRHCASRGSPGGRALLVLRRGPHRLLPRHARTAQVERRDRRRGDRIRERQTGCVRTGHSPNADLRSKHGAHGYLAVLARVKLHHLPAARKAGDASASRGADLRASSRRRLSGSAGALGIIRLERARSSVDRATGCGPVGRRFESSRARHFVFLVATSGARICLLFFERQFT